MHPNPIFRKTEIDHAVTLMREIGFGTLAVSADPVPLMAHVPFVLGDGFVDLHLVRSNPIARAVPDKCPARMTIMGPHGYISPDWYGVDDQVPTWNYAAVQLTGDLIALPHDELRDVLVRTSDSFENRLVPKPVWKLDKLSETAWSSMQRQILPFRFQINTIDSTFKLGQNKTDEARIGASDALAQSPIGQEVETLAQMMRTPPSNK